MPAAGSATQPEQFAFLTSGELRATGLSRRQIDDLVRAGSLVRVRKGRYVRADAPPALIRAARLGGRLDCISLLSAMSVFVLSSDRLHLQIDVGASRLPPSPAGVKRHWRITCAARTSLCADLVEALAQACRCQEPRAAIATLDSAWHLGLIDEQGIADVFARLPRRYRSLRPLLDSRSESGTETLLRLILRTLAHSIELQVQIDGVGRVDFLVDGWLIIECDSEAHHSGWAAQRRDRRRDLAAAALGYMTIRPLAEDILFHRDQVAQSLRAVLTRGPGANGVPNSSRTPRRTRLQGR